MKLKSTITCLVYFAYMTGFCQVITIDANKMVTDDAFSKLLFDDLNFLVVGDNTPSQGFSTESTEKDTELSLKGLLLSNENSFFTFDGKFSVDDGVYFFDENEGSKKSKFTINFFKPFKASRNYPRADKDSIARSLILGELKRRNTYYKTIEKYYISHRLMKDNGIPINNLDNKLLSIDLPEFQKIAKTLKPDYFATIRNDDSDTEVVKIRMKIDAFILENKLRVSSVGITESETYKIINIDDIDEKSYVTSKEADKNIVSFKGLDKLKLIEIYEASLSNLDSLKANLIASDLKRAEKNWSTVTIPYFSVSSFYQRESLTIFENIPEMKFDDLFDEQFGDLFGVEATLNYYRSTRKNTFYVRLIGSLGRGSNFSDFKKKTYQEMQIIGGTQVDPILVANQKVGYTNSIGYSYGVRSTLGIEMYLLIKNYGIFSTLSHNGTYYDFKKKAINDKHVYPFRAGLMANLRAKKDSKTALTLQVFIDRSDVTIDPTGTVAKSIDDWRLGFKFGLPIFLKPTK